jgi:hypothetical protein
VPEVKEPAFLKGKIAMSTESVALDPAFDLASLDEQKVDVFRRRMKSRLLAGGFMLTKMPLGFFAGLRVEEMSTAFCRTGLPYGWRTTNPFRSMYFAAQSMAAELSTGALAMLAVELAPAPVSMLITNLEAEFGKKATSWTTFTCEAGREILEAVAHTVATGEPVTARVETVGRMADGMEVSRFHFTWSFKRRTQH